MRYSRTWREPRKVTGATKTKRASGLKHPIKIGRLTLYLTDEELEQLTVVNWLDAHNVFYFFSDNAGKLTYLHGVKKRLLGKKAGVSDLIILQSPASSMFPPAAKGCVIEMKAKKGCRVTPAQEEFIERALFHGFLGKVAYSADEAILFLESLGYDKRK